MSEITSLPGVSNRLSGGACLSSRTIRAACKLFTSPTSSRSSLPLAELLDALWFLDQSIVSDHVSYDGTLPQDDIVSLRSLLCSFSEGSGFPPSHFRRIVPPSFLEDQVPSMSAAAAALRDTSSLRYCSGLDRPFPPDIATRFFNQLNQLAQARTPPPREQLKQIAQQFRGGKCIAGLALLPDFPTALKKAASTPCQFSSPALAMAVLVNRFRFTYVRHLAFGASDVFVPSAAWRPLSASHADAFTKVLLDHFRHHLGPHELQTLSASLGIQPAALPPLGLCALMNVSPTATPAVVACEAWQQFGEHRNLFRKLRATIRNTQPPAGCWTDPTGDEILDRLEKTLQDKLGKLNDQATNGSALERVVTAVTMEAPPVVKFATNTVLRYQGVPPFDANLQSRSIESAVGSAGGSLQTYITGHIDEYRQLKVTLSATNNLRLDRLAEKVDSVFNRKLEL